MFNNLLVVSSVIVEAEDGGTQVFGALKGFTRAALLRIGDAFTSFTACVLSVVTFLSGKLWIAFSLLLLLECI